MQMETDPAKKANKAKIPLEAIYPLEWEEAAFHEVLQGFKEMWKLKRTRFLQLTRKYRKSVVAGNSFYILCRRMI